MDRNTRFALAIFRRRARHVFSCKPERKLARLQMKLAATKARYRFSRARSRMLRLSKRMGETIIERYKGQVDAPPHDVATVKATAELLEQRNRSDTIAISIYHMVAYSDVLSLLILPGARRRFFPAGTGEVSFLIAVDSAVPTSDQGATVRIADRLLTQLASFIPRQHREGFVGDLLEDLHEYRVDHGWSERRLLLHVVAQVFILWRKHLRGLLGWGFVSWVAARVYSWVKGDGH